MKRFLKLFYIAIAVALAFTFAGLFINEQNQAKQQALAAQTVAANQKAAVHQKLNDCLDEVNKAFEDATTVAATKGLPPEAFNSYMQSAVQLQQSQITECQARYSTP